MARYIDADKIHEFVDTKVAEGKDGWANGVPYEWAYALTVIDMQPTADVAPKSEVAELIRENESLAKTVNEASSLIRKLRNKVEKSRTDVAREIFEEIEQYLSKEKFGEFYYNYLKDVLAELKKKYTEEKG